MIKYVLDKKRGSILILICCITYSVAYLSRLSYAANITTCSERNYKHIGEDGKMYKLSVPIMLKTLSRYGADAYIKKLKKVKAERVFFAIDSYITDEEAKRKTFDDLKKFISVFKDAGFEVGVWLWTFMAVDDKKYTHITSPNGRVSKDQVCPSDEDFGKFASDYIADVAKCAPDLIMFDDDFRYGFLDCGLGCACKNHRKYMSELLGEELPPEGLGKKIFGGRGNKYRSAFLSANRHYFELFANKMRKAVDTVNPEIRLGLCACMDVWDFCGISPDEISLLLAGDTKPFLRLIGAPYWSVNKSWGNRLQDVIELERMEKSWCKEGIEIFSEGDSFPRPRYNCSANRLECFDMALRACGTADGILKYIFDYSSSAGYEDGYYKACVAHAEIYKGIEEMFSDKDEVGVRVYEFRNKFEKMTVPEKWEGRDDVQNSFFSPAAKLMAASSIPTVYSGKGPGIVFGENAKYVSREDIASGLVLDIRAAEILEERGVDVGLKSAGESFYADEETFIGQGEYVRLGGSEVVSSEVKEGAKIESLVLSGNRKETGSYAYENAKGQRFFVLCFDGYFANDNSLKQYARAKQLAEKLQWLGGKKLPVTLPANPDLYVLCKRDKKAMSVFLGNFFEDGVNGLEIALDKKYDDIKFINCSGKLAGDKVVIDRLSPFKCASFEVTAF